MKKISMLVILSLLLQLSAITVSWAEPGIFFNYSTSKKIIFDLKTCKDSDAKLKNCVDLNVNLTKQLLTVKETNEGLVKDKAIFQKNVDLYKKSTDELAQRLSDCQTNKPSRFTWFGIGFLSAVVLGTLAAFAIK